jgi:hypothetical protein
MLFSLHRTLRQIFTKLCQLIIDVEHIPIIWIQSLRISIRTLLLLPLFLVLWTFRALLQHFLQVFPAWVGPTVLSAGMSLTSHTKNLKLVWNTENFSQVRVRASKECDIMDPAIAYIIFISHHHIGADIRIIVHIGKFDLSFILGLLLVWHIKDEVGIAQQVQQASIPVIWFFRPLNQYVSLITFPKVFSCASTYLVLIRPSRHVKRMHVHIGPSKCDLKHFMEMGKSVMCWDY